MKAFYSLLAMMCICASANVSAQVPVYSSHPSAAPTIFLDFDGHYVTGTSWNFSGPLDIGPSNLTSAQITEIYKRVSEDYRPFNVNVTTDSAKYWAAPANRRMRVLLTITSAWYGNVGGVAYMNSFNWGDNTPCFVFTALLGYNPKYIAEAASHEVGHTLGLRHQASYDANCVKTSDYNSGVGTGTIAWAPIMGVGYYRNMTLWNNGANPFGCTNFQDDLSIITSNANGIGYRSDDHSNNAGGSTTAAFSAGEFNVSGIIEKSTDADVFKFTMPVKGFFILNALPFGLANDDIGSNVDLQVELMTGSNNVAATYNPPNQLSVNIDTVLDAGTYYLRVKGVGNSYAPGYASLGSYSLKAIFSPYITLPVHQMELKGQAQGDRHLFNWTIVADEQVVSQFLEVSEDGINYRSAAQPDPLARYHSWVPLSAGNLFYRLRVIFDNGGTYYSNTVSLRSVVEARPHLVGNIVNGNVQVISPPGFYYIITDMNGRVISMGRLSPGGNSIPATFSRGMHLIIFRNGQRQYTERFMH